MSQNKFIFLFSILLVGNLKSADNQGLFSKDPKVVQEAINRGANINTDRNNIGLNPLQMAALNGYDKVVELLIKQGANLDVEVDEDAPAGYLDYPLNGYTALMLAANFGTRPDHAKIVALLSRAGAKDPEEHEYPGYPRHGSHAGYPRH